MDEVPSSPTVAALSAKSTTDSATTVVDSALVNQERSDIEPASDGGSDTDSALGDDDASITTSLRSSIYSYRVENGRTYHSYLESINYVLPNDTSEQYRLDLQHHLFALTLNGKLYQAPVQKDTSIQRILDLGTGTGIWAMDIGDEFPEAEVIGVDLSPIQPSYVPPNVRFIIDDIEDEWDYPSQLDFVFGRMLVGSISDWPKLMAQSHTNLRSGGWLELQDIVLRPQCADGTLQEDSYIKQWAEEMINATASINRFADSGLHYKQQMIDAGFINVTEVIYKWPTNTWPKNEPYRELGLWSFQNIVDELEGLSLALFTRSLGWSADSVMAFLAEVRKAMADRNVHVWWPIYVVYGQKP